MSNTPINFYNTKPTVNELVLVIFDEQDDDLSQFKGKLVEYPYKIFLTFNDIQKKKKEKYNKAVPLNKTLVGKITDVSNDILQVSLFHDNSKESREEQLKKALAKFIKNKQLTSIFIGLSKVFEIKVEYLWENIMYKIDEKRREEYSENPEELWNQIITKLPQENNDDNNIPFLLDYCITKEDDIKSIFNELDPKFYEKFKEGIDKLINTKPYKIISKIQIISTGGVENTIDLLKKALSDIDYDFTLKYEAASLMIFETNSTDSSEEDHTKLVNFIKMEGDKLNPKTYIKSEPPIKCS
jgi:hypothetical protein